MKWFIIQTNYAQSFNPQQSTVCVWKLCNKNIYQGDCWGLANSLETYSPGKCKYLSTKICYKNSVQLVVSCFFSNENPLGLLRGSETAVWASLKSNNLWTSPFSVSEFAKMLSSFDNVMIYLRGKLGKIQKKKKKGQKTHMLVVSHINEIYLHFHKLITSI